MIYHFYSFMHDDQCPPCIIRIAPNTVSLPIDITYLKVSETENLLDNQEELISTPLKVKFDLTVSILRNKYLVEIFCCCL
jgi:hypothetical protein